MPLRMPARSFSTRRHRQTRRRRPRNTRMKHHLHSSCNIVRFALLMIYQYRLGELQMNIQIPIHIHTLVHANLHLSDALAWYSPFPIRYLGIKFIAPRASIAIAVAIVVTKQIIPLRLLTPSYFERLIDGRQQIFGERGDEGADIVEISSCIGGIQTS